MKTTELVSATMHSKPQDLLDMELMIAHLLRVGVIASFVIVAIGIGAVIATGRTGYEQITLNDLNSLVQYRDGHTPFPHSLTEVITGVLDLKPYAIIALGLLVLIAIPILRVAVSVVAFAREHDRVYVLITAFVLAMLLLSLAIGEAGG